MAIFTNQANLIFNGQTTSSNITTGEVTSGLSLTKTSISRDYGRSDHVAYIVTFVNEGGAITGATLTDDLGSFTVGNNTVTPFTYVEGSLLFYQNGVLTDGPTAVGGPPLVITGIDIPAGGNVQIIYEAATNEFTPLMAGASVTNTAYLAGTGVVDPLSDTAVVTARDEVALTIAKAMYPTTVNEDGTLVYTFIIQNTGNTAVVATDDLIVTDTFNPILNPIAVTLDGVELTEGSQYTYDESTGEFATLPGAVTVPAATYTQDPVTGVYSITPGVAVITVTGRV
ncbi:MAG: hypothetical protein IJW53_04285 [Clostridia bacterium]|nr:hypothetical protein [Clostridia bacterium]